MNAFGVDHMERQQGKRVQSPKKAGRRRGRLPLLVVLLAVVILAGGYLGLCAYAMSSETIFPNTSAAGTELGGLTRSEARAQLELALDAYRQSTTSFQCGGQEFTVDGSNLSMDLDQVVEEAYTSSRSGSLLTAGARYLASPNAFLCNFDTGDEVFLADEYMRESENPNLVKVPIEGTESSMLFLRRRETGDPMTACIYQEIVNAWRRAAER